MKIFRNIFYFLYFRTIDIHLEVFTPFRAFLINRFLGEKHESLVVRPNVIILGFRKLKLGDHVSINHNCFLSCEGGLSIGDNVSIANGTSIMTTEHSYSDARTPIKYQPIKPCPVTIGNNVWIGANVTILAGANIPDGSIVAAGAVVKADLEKENSIYGGVPAKLLKSRL